MLKQLSSYTAYVAVSSLIVVGIFLLTKNQSVHTNIQAEQPYACHINKVLDGDSVIAVCPKLSDTPLSIRLRYIDAPELSQLPWGDDSRISLVNILKKNQNNSKIIFNGKDIYGRYLAELFIADKAVNKILVEQGRATVYPRYHPPLAYLSAMQTAKQQKLGIWQQSGLQQNPQRYRRLAK